MQNLEGVLPDEGKLDVIPLKDFWSTVKAIINDAVESTIWYVERRLQNEWFNEECRSIFEEKYAVRTIILQHETRKTLEP